MKICKKIRASITNMVNNEELHEYLREGLFSSVDQLFDLLHLLKRKLLHTHHARCMIPVFDDITKHKLYASNKDIEMTKNLNKFRCKVPDNRLLSPDPNEHCFIMVEVRHLEMAINILREIGLVARTEEVGHLNEVRRGKELVYFDKSLRSQRYVPPTSADDGVMSPVIARLCLFNKNSDNAQYVDSYGVSSYLAKYVTDIDKVAKVYTRAPPYRGDGNME